MRDISDIDNKRMATIKCDIMHYNYQVKHIPGQTNCIADCLSRRPEWLLGKVNDSDSSQDRGVDDSRDELCMRVITEAMHLLKDNPAILAIEEAGKKDPDYSMIIEHIRANKNFKELPTHSEGYRMGGEWPKLEILPEADVIILRDSSTVSKIYPPVSYRPLILEELHKSGRQSAAVFERARIHYIWPSIRKDINDHVKSCTRCLEIKPSKS